MSTPPTHPNRTELQNYMSMFRDIHRSSTIIADAIRVRESRALRLLGLQPKEDPGSGPIDVTNPHRCPFCLLEFHDPTVISKICGHGMHEKCAKRYVSKTEEPLMCSICRAPFREDDLVLLRGVIPPTTEATAWRFVHLTEPWELKDVEQSSDSKMRLDSSADRLLINIKFLLSHQQNFSRVMEATLESQRRATNDEVTARARYRRKKTELVERERKVEETEDNLIITKVRNEEFMAKCAKNIQNEESHLLKIMEALSRRQNKLSRSLTDIAAREEDIHTEMKEFETRRKKEEDLLKKMREEVRAERQKLEATNVVGDAELRGMIHTVKPGEVYDVDEWDPEQVIAPQHPVGEENREVKTRTRDEDIIEETPFSVNHGKRSTRHSPVRKRCRRN